MRVSEIINELFQPGKHWSWTFRGSEEAFAEFKVGDIEYQWHAMLVQNEIANKNKWIIEFSRKGQVNYDKAYGLTGTGHATEVMSIVTDIIRAFLNQYGDKVESLQFSADEESRNKLYTRMIHRLLPDWKLQKIAGSNTTVFILDKPKEPTQESSQLSEITKLKKDDYEVRGTTPFWMADDELQRLADLKKYPIKGRESLYLVVNTQGHNDLEIYAFSAQSKYPVGSLILKNIKNSR